MVALYIGSARVSIASTLTMCLGNPPVCAGTPVPDLCREHGVSTATFYKWRAKFGGMDVSLMAKMKELEDENRRLKKMYVDAQMRALIVEEALAKK